MKVLVVARSFTRGGSATGAANLALALEAARINVVRESADGKRTLLRKVERALERTLPDAQETHALLLGPPCLDLPALVQRHAPDIVQLCDISANTISMETVAHLPCPSVHRMSDFWPYHGPQHYAERPNDTTPGLANVLYDRAGYVALRPTLRVAPSDWLADKVAAAGSARPQVILNAVPLVPEAKPKSLGHGILKLGFIANKLGHPRKGLARLGPALGRLDREVQLITFGAPPAPPGLPNAVHRGPFAKSEIGRVMEEIDILLCPHQRDNSPNSVTEAFAHGVPVIGQSGTGMDSYIEPSRGALLDFWEDTADLEPALQHITSDYTSRSAAALDFARTELAAKTIGGAYADLYRELLTSR